MTSCYLINLILLAKALLNAQDPQEKIVMLIQANGVEEFLNHAEPIKSYIDQAEAEVQVALLSVVAIGEGDILFQGWGEENDLSAKLQVLTQQLIEVERFYGSIGGIVGYHKTMLELMVNDQNEVDENFNYLEPPRIEIYEESEGRKQFVEWGIQGMPKLAEIYAVGGAGDRLSLVDELTGESLPAAELPFCGRTLLELLVRDLEAREAAYEIFNGEKIITPIILMTSNEKDNDRRMREICEKNQWFGRPRNSFYFIIQPLVPVVTIEGHWVMSSPFEIYRKPGGHGVIWKLMEDQGAFDWLEKKGRTKALVRQINNPLAGQDDGLLAFIGIGVHENKTFGFASCPRRVHASEGMNVLIEKRRDDQCFYSLTNVEYTEFSKKGIKDVSDIKGGEFSRFPANTNLLFVDLKRVRSLIPVCPVPGMLINLKSKAPYRSPDGSVRQIAAGRLESTMQNIADAIEFKSAEMNKMPVYLTYNNREKTIGVTKCSFNPDNYSNETPEMCFYTLLSLNCRLLKDYCKVETPSFAGKEHYLKTGPNILFLYHPALGPQYALIGNKISGGKFEDGAELQVELADVEIKNLALSGSLLISGNHREGVCRLIDTVVKNKGINRNKTKTYWKNRLDRDESIEIILEGKSEFLAKNVVFAGEHKIIVPDGIRIRARQQDEEIFFEKEEIK